MHFEISRAVKFGKQLTAAQRTSALFAEEPVVMGKVLRRGLPPMKLTPEQYERNKTHLKRLESAGAILIKEVAPSDFHSFTQPEDTKVPADEVPVQELAPATDAIPSLTPASDEKIEDTFSIQVDPPAQMLDIKFENSEAKDMEDSHQPKKRGKKADK